MKKPVEQIFDGITQKMMIDFFGVDATNPHFGDKGANREERVRNFLKYYLPKKYGIGTGFIIDKEGNQSSQTDIVIYDSHNGVVLPSESSSYFPCECVCAVVEVKSLLNRHEIESCVLALSKIRLLARPKSLTPIRSFVFAYTTSWKNESWLQTLNYFYYASKKLNSEVPALVLALENPLEHTGFLLASEMSSIYHSHIYDKNPLLCFFSQMLHLLVKSDTEVPDLWNQYSTWFPNDRIARIFKNPEKEND